MYETEIKKLKSERNKNIEDNRTLLDTCIAAKRDPNTEEQGQFDTRNDAIAQQDSRISAYERLSKPNVELDPDQVEDRTGGRPGLEQRTGKKETRKHATPEYRAAYQDFLVNVDRRAITMADQSSGGYLLAPVQVSEDIVRQVDNMVFIKQKAKRYKVTTAQALGVRRKTARMSDATWTTEIGSIGPADTAMAFDRRDLTPYLLTKLALVSTRMMESGQDVESEVNDELAYKYAVTEENAFLNGTGVNQPLGIFNTTHPDAIQGRDVVTVTPGKLSADDFITARYSIKQGYLNPKDAAWMLNRTVVAAARMIKDTQGRYIWREGFATGAPDTIVDLPYAISEYAPGVISTGNFIAVLGNWKYYAIAEVTDLKIQKLVELYAGNNEVGFKGQAFIDGQPVMDEAFARIKVA